MRHRSRAGRLAVSRVSIRPQPTRSSGTTEVCQQAKGGVAARHFQESWRTECLCQRGIERKPRHRRRRMRVSHSQPLPKSFSRSRSEEHTSELQSHSDLVCRLLLEKKKKAKTRRRTKSRRRARATTAPTSQTTNSTHAT